MMRRYTIGLLLIYSSLSAQPGDYAFDVVNTGFDELNPVLSPDGKTLFVTLAHHPENIGGRQDPGDIWYAENNAGVWSGLKHDKNTFNDRGYNGVAGFSSDGNTIWLLTHYAAGGNTKTQGISYSIRGGSGWSTPLNVTIPYFQNRSQLVSGHITPDERVFVFAAESYGTYGVEDIYICVRNADGSWSAPRNLGKGINTPFQEMSPAISMDGTRLYFSSNGLKGLGSFDVFVCDRLDDTFLKWSTPRNVVDVNTEAREMYYNESLHGVALYTSTKDSDGYGDIKAVKLTTDTNAYVSVDTSIRIAPIERLPGEKKITVHGTVRNSRTGEQLNATIVFKGSGQDVASPALPVTASKQNGYAVQIPSVKKYDVVIESPGFISSLEELDMATYEMKDLEMNFSLQPIEVGTTVNLKNVLFEQSKTELLPPSYAQLDVVVAFLKSNPKVKIELSGHTDNRGIPAQNIKLSQARVEKVRDYLLSKGIDANRVKGKGYGGSQPIASNDSEETRQLNRRVEFTIRKL